MSRTSRLILTLAISLLPIPALAYIGPGAGLSAIGSLFSLISAVFLALVGFIWYPVRRLLRRMRQKQPHLGE